MGGSPSGPSRQPGYCPETQPIGSFVGNTAHSSSIGIRIYPQYHPSVLPCGGGGPAAQDFYNSTVYANGLGIFHKKVGSVHHHFNRYINNGDGHHWIRYEADYTWNPNIADSLFICNTNSAGGCGSKAIWGPQVRADTLMPRVNFLELVHALALSCVDGVLLWKRPYYRQLQKLWRFGWVPRLQLGGDVRAGWLHVPL
jgi:hypothetical protein